MTFHIYLMKINHEIYFSWQAQYLVMFEGHSGCSAHCKLNEVSCVATIKHKCRSFIVLCIPEIAPRNVSDVSCVATIKHECCSSIVFCIPELAPRNSNMLRQSNK